MQHHCASAKKNRFTVALMSSKCRIYSSHTHLACTKAIAEQFLNVCGN